MSSKVSDHIIKQSDDKANPDPGLLRLKRLVEQVIELHRSHPGKAMKLAREAFPLANRLGDKRGKFELLLCFARMEARKGRLEIAETNLSEALAQLPGRRADKDSLCRIYLAMGAVYYLQQKHQLALEYYSQALACNVDKYKVDLYLNIANLYFTNSNFHKSLQYQRRALRLAQAQGNSEKQIFCLSNIGAIYVKTDQDLRALNSFQEALAIINTLDGYDYTRCNCALNLGAVHGRLAQWEEAERQYKEAIRVARQNQFHQELAKAYQYLGELKASTDDASSFLYYLYRSRKLAKDNNFEAILIDVLRHLQQHFEKQQDFKQAYAYLKEMAEVQASIEHNKQQKALSQLLDSKDKEISILERQRDQIEEQRLKLERNNRELEKSNRELEQYAYVVAHDLKEPLRNISSFTSLIERRYAGQLDETAREYMSFVVRNAGRMNTLLTELLRYTTLRRLPEDKVRETAAEEVVQQVVRDLQGKIKESGAVLFLGDLPSMSVSFDHLYQLFFSLIDNALQFNKSEKPEVHISARRDGDKVEFSVRDNGIGIAKAYQGKIFQLFQRLDRDRYSGTGIGLALCHKIVQLYDGEIWLDSEAGNGSTFYFTLKD
ncbi:MAG: tetratricopeptide repeat protein [Bacteroidetes bacterium]|nr:tetratricopeptide repeat protein [Bacteroidota bacterium]